MHDVSRRWFLVVRALTSSASAKIMPIDRDICMEDLMIDHNVAIGHLIRGQRRGRGWGRGRWTKHGRGRYDPDFGHCYRQVRNVLTDGVGVNHAVVVSYNHDPGVTWGHAFIRVYRQRIDEFWAWKRRNYIKCQPPMILRVSDPSHSSSPIFLVFLIYNCKFSLAIKCDS